MTRRWTIAEFDLIAPFALWMVLMALLPPTPAMYVVRVAAVAALVLALALRGRWYARVRFSAGALVWGVAAGLAVFAIWVGPESCAWYRKFGVLGEGGTAGIAAAPAVMKAIRLVGSATVIALAEELFFRRWLMRWAGFGWMVALFAIEHDRYLVAAVAGVVYGLLARRRGIFAAVVAHGVTNLVLGLYVLKTGAWQLW